MMNIIFEMPSWKTGIVKRLRRITLEQILEAAGIVLFFAIMIFMMIVPIIFAIYAPPTMDF